MQRGRVDETRTNDFFFFFFKKKNLYTFNLITAVVADGHPRAAGAADDDALAQGGAFAGRPGGAVTAVRGGVSGQLGDVGVVLVKVM